MDFTFFLVSIMTFLPLLACVDELREGKGASDKVSRAIIGRTGQRREELGLALSKRKKVREEYSLNWKFDGAH